MRRVDPEPSWPDSWRVSHAYDLLELYGGTADRAYAASYRVRRDETLALVSGAVAPGARILDLGAGQGNFSLALAERGYRVTWNDFRDELAGYVRLKHERGEIEYAPGNAFDLRFERPFDGVLLTEVIEHVAHPDDFLRQAAALVAPGGRLVLTTPNGAYFRNRLPRFSDCPDPSRYEADQFRPDADGHIFLLHPDELPPLAARAGLVLERLVLFTTPLTAGHVKTAPLLSLLPAGLVEALERAARRLPLPLRQKVLVQMGAVLRRP